MAFCGSGVSGLLFILVIYAIADEGLVWSGATDKCLWVGMRGGVIWVYI